MAQWNPTIAMKTAKEMLDTDRKENAIQVLIDCLSGKKNKNQWLPILEEVATLLLDTCLKTQNHKAVKDGLHQYRTICFPSNTSSLEKVIYEFLVKGDTLVREAKESGANAKSPEDESIESKILRSVSGDAFEDRNERTHIQPYIKFLWESFRAILDLVRNKPKLELTYYNTAVKAMRFCVTYERKQEFKRIGEMLRLHFAQLITHGSANSAMISVSSIQASQNSLNCLYGARFEYLNCSVRLELWQEAFRTVEDINEVMLIIKQQPAPQRMANYFEKLAQLFWTSHNYVFHAYAWLRFYLISRDQNRSLSEEDLQRLASVVLVSALSVPVQHSNAEQSQNHQDFFELHLEKEKNSRLSALLGKSTTLRREQLLKEICHHDIPSKALPEVRNLFHLAETKFHPMELCNSLSDVFTFVQESSVLSRYAVLLKKACFTRQLQQLSKVFQTMKIDRIYQLAPVSCPHQVEKLIVRCANSGLVTARIDHRQKTLTFVNNSLESSNVKSNLFSVYDKLNSAVKLIQPEDAEARSEQKNEFFKIVPQMADHEYKENLYRSDAIEDEREKKETIEKLKARLVELRAELDSLNNPSPDKTEENKEKTITAAQKEKIKARNQAEEKKAALQKKLGRLIVKLDYLERARREEEAPLLQREFEESTTKDREIYEERTQRYLSKQEEEHKKDLEQKKRLSKMKSEAEKLQSELLEEKKKAYEEQLAEIQKHNETIRAKIAEEKEKLRQQLIEEEKERRAREEERRLAEEQRRKEEEERRKQEAGKGGSWADQDESPPSSPVQSRTNPWGAAKSGGPSSGWPRQTSERPGRPAGRDSTWGSRESRDTERDSGAYRAPVRDRDSRAPSSRWEKDSNPSTGRDSGAYRAPVRDRDTRPSNRWGKDSNPSSGRDSNPSSGAYRPPGRDSGRDSERRDSGSRYGSKDTGRDSRWGSNRTSSRDQPSSSGNAHADKWRK